MAFKFCVERGNKVCGEQATLFQNETYYIAEVDQMKKELDRKAVAG